MIALSEGITPEHLAQTYTDPLMSRVSDDGQQMYPVFHELAQYLSAWVDDVFVGAYLVIRYSRFEYEAHSLLTTKATLHARKLGALLLEWVFGHDEVLRVTGYIRDGLTSAINHCLRMGFVREGFRRNAVLCNGVPTGIHILGITREDWGKL